MPIKYTYEFKTLAVDLVIHTQSDPSTANGAIRRVAKELGLSSETLHTWVRNDKDSGATAPAQSIDLEAENKRLRPELTETKKPTRS